MIRFYKKVYKFFYKHISNFPSAKSLIFTCFISFFYSNLCLFKVIYENKIKEIYKSIIPQKEISSNKLISTNMEDLVNQLKTYSLESQTEITVSYTHLTLPTICSV